MMCVVLRLLYACECCWGDSPQSEAAILCPKFAADDLTQLVVLNGVQDTHCSRGGVVNLDGHSRLQKKERKLLASAVKEKEHSLGPLYRLEPLNKGHTGTILYREKVSLVQVHITT